MSDCSIYIQNKELLYIDNIRIERSLANLAYGFSCSCVPHKTEVRAGMKIQVYYKDDKQDPIFSGYVDEMKIRLASAEKSLEIQARSYACDLLDSTDSFEQIEGNLYEIAKQVCSRYAVSVSKHPALELGNARFECQAQSPFQVLSKLVAAQGGILASSGWGMLELAVPRTNTPGSTLTLSDITKIEYRQNWTQRFHTYRSTSEGEAQEETDSVIRKTRTNEISAQGEDVASLKAQLKNEKQQRKGRSQELRLELPSWQIIGGDTHWYENSNVELDVKQMGIENQSFFLHGVVLSLSKSSGYRAELSLCERSAFEQVKGSSGTTPKQPKQQKQQKDDWYFSWEKMNNPEERQ